MLATPALLCRTPGDGAGRRAGVGLAANGFSQAMTLTAARFAGSARERFQVLRGEVTTRRGPTGRYTRAICG
eukprot:scaffold66054_cov60-Phaeocystis_antarctica.AAC.2